MLELAKLRLKDAKSRIDRYIDNNILEWGNEIILTAAKNNARAAGLSDTAIEGIKLIHNGFKKVRLQWEYWGPNGEPIHFYIENDTMPHVIRAKGKSYGGANILRWFAESGKPIFRPEVHHPGTKGKHIIRNSWEEARPRFIEKITSETENYLQVNRL